MQGMLIINATQKGSNPSQHNTDNWSNLNLGNVALTHTKTKQKKEVLIPKIIDCKLIILLFVKISGILNPPKNKIAVIVENITIELYSLRKNKTKGTLECSVKKPATNSDSKY